MTIVPNEAGPPALPAHDREHLVTELDGWTAVLPDVVELARAIHSTDFVPKGLRGSVGGTAAAILYGREVGLGPMTTLQTTYVVHGRVGVAAEIMRAMVLTAGHTLLFTESTSAICTVKGRRAGTDEWTAVTWTIDDAKKARLIKPDSSWVTVPRRMLQARASSELCQMLFPDVIRGFRSVEELDDEAASNGTPPSGGTATVARQPRARRTPTPPVLPAPPPAQTPAAATAGPPLPGEPGYDGEPVGAAPEEPQPVPGRAGGGEDPGDAAPTPQTTGREGEPLPEGGDPDPAGEGAVESLGSAAPSLDRPNPAVMKMLWLQAGRFGLTDPDQRTRRLELTSMLLGRPLGRELLTYNDLTADETSQLADILSRVRSLDALRALANQTSPQGDD